MKPKKDAFIILENIRSSENVGSIFRTADAVGIKKIFLGGYTPAPVDRFGRENKKLLKTALGAEQSVPWEKEADTGLLVKKLQQKGYQCIAVEQDSRAISYKSAKNSPLDVFIFGNEVEGVSQEILDLCDQWIDIPMHGEKESLNVSVSVGIILYGLLMEPASN
jgi:23S rRNA (guanosine2251-2'-O)-methyltransferase